MFERRLYHHIDWALLLAVAALCLLGITQIYAVLLGVLALVVCLSIDYRSLADKSHFIYIAVIALLACVLFFGAVRGGSRRWIDLDVFNIQPSEFAKAALALVLAKFFGESRRGTVTRVDLVVAGALTAIPLVLIAQQPDLGTALLVTAAGFFVLFLAGLSWKIIAGIGVAGTASLPLVWSVLHDYQRQRILTLLDPTQDPLGAGYHTIQSTIAVGAGGLIGKGWLKGTQAHLDFIPERTTDFIFAVYSEEFGLFGNLVLLLVFLLAIARGMVITANAPTLFARLLAGAVTLTFFTYAFTH